MLHSVVKRKAESVLHRILVEFRGREEIGSRLANQHPDAVVFVDSLSISSLTHALDGDSSTYLTSGRAVPELSSSKVVHQGVLHDHQRECQTSRREERKRQE